METSAAEDRERWRARNIRETPTPATEQTTRRRRRRRDILAAWEECLCQVLLGYHAPPAAHWSKWLSCHQHSHSHRPAHSHQSTNYSYTGSVQITHTRPVTKHLFWGCFPPLFCSLSSVPSPLFTLPQTGNTIQLRDVQEHWFPHPASENDICSHKTRSLDYQYTKKCVCVQACGTNTFLCI